MISVVDGGKYVSTANVVSTEQFAFAWEANAMALVKAGSTAQYTFWYDQSFENYVQDGTTYHIEPARSQAVMAACDADFNQLFGIWFQGKSASQKNIQVNLVRGQRTDANHSWGASWKQPAASSSATITIYEPPEFFPNSNMPTLTVSDPIYIRYLLISEVSEMLMRDQTSGGGWFEASSGPSGSRDEGSVGEGLSLFLSGQFLQLHPNENTGQDRSSINNAIWAYHNSAQNWLNSSRTDYINVNDDDTSSGLFGNPPSGCTVLFMYYLNYNLGYSIPQIVTHGPGSTGTLKQVYTNLTGDTADPFPPFKKLLDDSYPQGTPLATYLHDNPWPLPPPPVSGGGGGGPVHHPPGWPFV